MGIWCLYIVVQVGKEHLYRLLREIGLVVHTRLGWQTKALREQYGLTKTKSKNKQSFDSHCVDAFVLAASVSGARHPTCTRLWYLVPARLHRRQLHRFQASKGGERKPYGGTRTLGLKRWTLVRHPKYGLCTVGGFDRNKQTISLHAYRSNKRLTQAARVKECRILTWVAWRYILRNIGDHTIRRLRYREVSMNVSIRRVLSLSALALFLALVLTFNPFSSRGAAALLPNRLPRVKK
jgi:hypothetical protein